MKVLAFGEVLWDIIDDDAHLGGAPLNFAAHIVQCGGQAAILSRLGADKFGDNARHRIEKLGVDCSLLQTDHEKATGTVPVILIKGQPDYYITPDVAYDYIDYAEAKNALDSEQFEVFYFGTLAQRGQSRKTLKKILSHFDFQLKFYDINLRKDCYNEEIIRYSLEQANIVKLNEDEMVEMAQMLFNKELSPSDFFRELRLSFPNLEHVILTAGGDGCYVYQNHTLHHLRSEPVHVVDAIGAGDSFSAAFIYSFFKSGDILKSAKIGNRVGGFVASSSGAIPKYSEEIKSILADGHL